MRKWIKSELADIYDGIGGILHSLKELRKEISVFRDEMAELRKEFSELKAEMEARGEAADAAVERVNTAFQKELEMGFSYNPYEHTGG